MDNETYEEVMSKGHELTLDFNEDISNLISAGKFDHQFPDIIKDLKSRKNNNTGKKEVKIFIFTCRDLFGREAYHDHNDQEIISTMRRWSLNPAGELHGIYPMLNLCTKRPDLIKINHIGRRSALIDLGIKYKNKIDSNHPRYLSLITEGDLTLGSTFGPWTRGDTFLTVSEM